MKLKTTKYERRVTTVDKPELSLRAVSDEKTNKRFIEGYGAVFNKESRVIYERGKVFKEIIQRNAFDKVLSQEPNVIATINHDPNQGLARTKNGTLSLSTDDYGLKYRFEVPNTTLGNDLYEMVRNGYYTESSFVFTVTENDSSFEKRNGETYHIVRSINSLHDVCVATNGCYSDTDVTVSERLLKRALDSDSVSGSSSTGSTVVVEVDVAVVPQTDDGNQDQPAAVLVADDVEGLELTIIKLKLC